MPAPDDYALPYSSYLEGCAEQRLVMARCDDCGSWQLPAFFTCRACGGRDLSPATASGRGTVASFTEVHRGSNAFFAARTPYVICLVDLDEGPRLMMQGRGRVAIGAAVTVGFAADTPDGQPAPFAAVETPDAV